MNKGSLITLLGSLVLAAFVAWVGNAWIEMKYGTVATPPESVKVLAAAKDLPIGSKIDPTSLKILEFPPGSAPEGHLTAPEQILGKRLKEPVYAGEVILSRRLLEDSAANMLSVIITPGKRALAVRVDDIIGVSGFILPGSHVDVIASRDGQKVHTVLQDIKVLSVDQALTAESNALHAKTVSLEVDPRQAEILMEATESGSVRLALRHQTDRGMEPASLVKEATARIEPADPHAANPQKNLKSVIVIRGISETRTGDLTDPTSPSETKL
jgi:pilus assembly protein CpaB